VEHFCHEVLLVISAFDTLNFEHLATPLLHDIAALYQSVNVVLLFRSLKLPSASAAKLKQAEAAMSAGGSKRKKKKFHATLDMHLAFSQRKVDPEAGSELCVASLQGMYYG